MPVDDSMRRVAYVRETENYFFLALSRPFSRTTAGYKRFYELADSEHRLDGGGQVYVYSREHFGWDESSQAEDFKGHIDIIANELGNISLNTEIELIDLAAS